MTVLVDPTHCKLVAPKMAQYDALTLLPFFTNNDSVVCGGAVLVIGNDTIVQNLHPHKSPQDDITGLKPFRRGSFGPKNKVGNVFCT